MVWLDFNQRHRIGFAFPGVLAGMIRVPNDVRHLVFLFLFFRLTCLSFHQTKKGRERRVGEGVRKVVARRFRRAVRISYPMTANSHFVFSISSKERRWKRVWQTKKSFVSPPPHRLSYCLDSIQIFPVLNYWARARFMYIYIKQKKKKNYSPLARASSFLKDIGFSFHVCLYWFVRSTGHVVSSRFFFFF